MKSWLFILVQMILFKILDCYIPKITYFEVYNLA